MNYAHQFKQNLLSFTDEIIELFPENNKKLLYFRVLIEKAEPDSLIRMFSKEIEPYRDMIINRDEMLFSEGTLFKSLGSQNSEILQIIWKSSDIDESDRDIIWSWFDTFIYLINQSNVRYC